MSSAAKNPSGWREIYLKRNFSMKCIYFLESLLAEKHNMKSLDYLALIAIRQSDHLGKINQFALLYFETNLFLFFKSRSVSL